MNTNLFFPKNLRAALTVSIIILLFTTSAHAAAGTLDPTFGANGSAIIKFNGLPSSIEDAVLQTDGKIVTLGTVKLNDGQSKKVIARYNSNGTVDNTFGTNGITQIEINSFSALLIALQSDGKIIIGGLSSSNFAVARYTNNGALDTSFGVNGMNHLNLNDSHGSPKDMLIQSDGKIIVVGGHIVGQSNFTDFFIARFNSNGIPDETFVANGFNIIDKTYFPNNRYNYGKAALIQSDGKIIISGDMMDNDAKINLSLARLNQNGSLDASTFGTNGKGTVTTLIPNFENSSGALALQADGKFIAAGTQRKGGGIVNENLVVVRYNTNGTLDTTFGGTGIIITDFGNDEQTDDLLIQADGKIIIVGKTSSLGSSSDFLLVRYNKDGSLDTTFGANGKLITDFGGNADIATGTARQPDNKIIVAGASGDSAILARYETNTSSTAPGTATFKSADAHDGWILESAEKSNLGGILDKTSTIINVGDDAKDRQYRGFLSFNTISLPDDALITSAQVKVRRQGFVGTDAFKTHDNLLLDIRSGTFSNDVLLKLNDFSAVANIGSAQDKLIESPSNWYTANLSSVNLGFVNKYGVTQFRLGFSKDDNDDMGADYIKFFSGSAASADQPQLIVNYSSNSVGTNTYNQAPVITSNGGLATAGLVVYENTTSITTVTATDADLPIQPLTYSILSESDSALFSIAADTGILTFVTAPNYESISLGTIYHVMVQASDGSLSDTQDIAVTVGNVNEFAPEITSNGGGATASVNLSENTSAVTTVTASDGDQQALTYSITGGVDATLFSLNPSDGKLSFVTAPSYNVPNDAGLDHVYNVTVQASDGALNDSQEIIVTILNPNNTATGITTLHHFGSQTDNGRIPYGMLVAYNGSLYGTTTYGGAPYNVPPTNPANKGNVFKMNLDGTGFTVLHEFTGGANDGWKPWSGLAIAGDMIFGSTVYGGPRGESGGVLYEMNINGSGFRILHAFGESGDGFGGSTSPILVGDTLYGITRWGGNGTGTLYSYNTTTEVYSQLHRFAANSSDGGTPLGTLTAGNDGFLYGLTWLGGKNNMGTLFRIKLDGSAFETLYHFAGGAQGKYPYDTLMFDGGHTLYGTTLGEYGVNPADLGTIFKYDLANKTYSVLHKFAGGLNDGGKPNGSLTLSSDGSTLYGTTHGDDAWGGKEFGILYQINIDGTGFKILYEFSGGMAGATPMRTPLLINGNLYGMTAYGGTENYGTIWRYPISNAPAPQANFIEPALNVYAPVITSNNIVSTVENNIAVTTITAADADIPAPSLSYSIIGGADAMLLSINSATGELVFIAAPDYEIPADVGLDNLYNVTVQASDGTFAVTQEVAITVASVNDNSPAITSNGFVSISENNPAIETVRAADTDLPTQILSYSIIGGADAMLFSIHPATGDLSFIAAPDYEIPMDSDKNNMYNVIVQASDGERVGTQDVTVSINAINDNYPSITSTGTLSITENGTTVTTVTTYDGDLPAQTLAYSIVGGQDFALFSINSFTGELSFVTARDYEMPQDTGMDNMYNVIVQASDGTLASTQDISVAITALNDNLPVITSPGSFAVLENTVTVTTVTARDADLPAQTLTYSIINSPDSSAFTINSTTGMLAFITARDYETPGDFGADNIYNVTVQVSDGILSTTQNIAASIIAVNDNMPAITSLNNFIVPENVSTIAAITAVDADHPTQLLTYTISGGMDAVKFSIVNATGALTFIIAPDFEVPLDFNLDNIYEITIQVSDGAYIKTQNISIQVENAD